MASTFEVLFDNPSILGYFPHPETLLILLNSGFLRAFCASVMNAHLRVRPCTQPDSDPPVENIHTLLIKFEIFD